MIISYISGGDTDAFKTAADLIQNDHHHKFTELYLSSCNKNLKHCQSFPPLLQNVKMCHINSALAVVKCSLSTHLINYIVHMFSTTTYDDKHLYSLHTLTHQMLYPIILAQFTTSDDWSSPLCFIMIMRNILWHLFTQYASVVCKNRSVTYYILPSFEFILDTIVSNTCKRKYLSTLWYKLEMSFMYVFRFSRHWQ